MLIAHRPRPGKYGEKDDEDSVLSASCSLPLRVPIDVGLIVPVSVAAVSYYEILCDGMFLVVIARYSPNPSNGKVESHGLTIEAILHHPMQSEQEKQQQNSREEH